MKNSFILLKIKNINIFEIQKFLTYNDIYYKDLVYKDKIIFIKINIKDYRKLINNYDKKRIKIIKYYGIEGLKEFIKRRYIFILSLILSLIMLYILTNTIFEVTIVSNNKELKEIINEELKEHNIEKYKFIKSYKEIEKIKKEILNNNTSTIEWLEISRKGTTYTINITERIKNDETKKESKRHVIASKAALILKIVNRKGQVVKYVNDYVQKGEIIVSGDIYRNEDIVSTISADADVYGEVWYTVNVTIPFEYVEYSPTGKTINHYYLKFPSFDMTLLGYYNKDNVIVEKEVLIDKPYLFFKLIKEKKTVYKYERFKITEKEAINEAIKRAEKSITAGLNNNEYIIDKNVLKKSTFSSKINVEIFFKVYEDIKDYFEIENTLESE